MFLICTVFYILEVRRTVATTACVPCTVLITNWKWTEQTVLSHCPEQYIVTLYSLVPRPPPFSPYVCIHNNTWSSTPVYYCEC